MEIPTNVMEYEFRARAPHTRASSTSVCLAQNLLIKVILGTYLTFNKMILQGKYDLKLNDI